jgi:assimilatory nitrate reductase catalytic subunit
VNAQPLHEKDLVAPTVRTTCPYCGVGCGVLATPDGRGGAGIAGDPAHPANFGRLCSKGSALGETLSLEDRLLHPMVDGERVGWDAALGRIADGIRRSVARHGPSAVAFYLSGQLLTEDYYVANKLAKGFVGTPHVDTNSRLCMSSSVAAHKRAFGTDTVPGCYEDLDEADLIVLVGSNTAWCHPILFRRMLDARTARGTKLVVIDPRRTETAAEADLFLGLAPGTDAALFSGLLAHLATSDAIDRTYLDAHTTGFTAALTRAREIAPDPAATARATGLAEADVVRFFTLFADTTRVVTAFSQGVNQSAQGTDKANSIINCHLATGRIGTAGAGPLSLTGQPNAMGGREVGGLANMLAAHMDFSEPERDRVRRFWDAPNLVTGPGLKAVALFEAVRARQIKALWVMGTNPAVSMPDADGVRAALSELDLLVVSDVSMASDTARIALGPNGVLLPALAWGEKDGTVTNSERRISRQRAFLPPPGEARADWWALSRIGERLGHGAAFDYPGPAAIFREHAALSAFENGGTRDFDLGGLVDLGDEAYATATPVQWPLPAGAPHGHARLFARGGFFTPDRRARVVPVEPSRLAAPTDAAHAFRLNTGRVRDQWHTMTRTGKSPRLAAHRPMPYVEVNLADAARLGLVEGDFARVSTAYGAAVLQVVLDPGQHSGNLFAPMHWSAATASHGRVGALTQGLVDPISGQPELKATPAAIARVSFARHGFALARGSIPPPPDSWWWARVRVEGGTGMLFATDAGGEEAAAYLGTLASGEEHAAFSTRDIYRGAAYAQGLLTACVFLGPRETLPSWESVKGLLAVGALDPTTRRTLIAGRAVAAGGPTVCACYGIRLDVIAGAITDGCTTPATVGAATKAGTNCGSCVPEIRRLIAAESRKWASITAPEPPGAVAEGARVS